MSFAIEQERSALKAAFEIQRRAELTDIRVTHCNANGFEGAEQSFQGPLKLGMRSDSKVHSFSPGRLQVSISIDFEAKDSSQEAKVVFLLGLGFLLAYELEGEYLPSPDQLDAFKDGNAIFNCWPFARELAQNLTMRMGLAVPPIPLFRVVPKIDPVAIEHPPGDDKPTSEPKPPGRKRIATRRTKALRSA
jgi:hypothetical protein